MKHMKSFAPKPWFAPQPVLIIGTYNKDGIANAMNAAWAGQWDMKEIMISMGNHVTTDNLRSEEHTSELQSLLIVHLVCRLLPDTSHLQEY